MSPILDSERLPCYDRRSYKATPHGWSRRGHGIKGVSLTQEQNTTRKRGGSSKGRPIATGVDRLQTDADAARVIGRQYGRLTVVSIGPRATGGQRRFKCRCSCGTEKNIAWSALKSGLSQSCGCLAAEIQSTTHRTHGLTVGKRHPLYKTWLEMHARCRPAHRRYADWGGRGIYVCERWSGRDGFPNFVADMGPKPSPRHSIDRIDNDGPYSPENCRWADPVTQRRNQRRYMEMH